MKELLFNVLPRYTFISSAWEYNACVYISHNRTHKLERKHTKIVPKEWKVGIHIIALFVLSCVLIPLHSHVYGSEQRGRSDSVGSVMHHNAPNYIKRTSTSSLGCDANIHNSCCFHSHHLRWREHPGAVIRSRSIPVFSRMEMPGLA